MDHFKTFKDSQVPYLNISFSKHFQGLEYFFVEFTVADPECARGGGVSHILAEKRIVSFTLFKKMYENAIFSPIMWGGGGVRRVRTMLDPPLIQALSNTCTNPDITVFEPSL